MLSYRIFLAGASGAIGRRLTPLLRSTGHYVCGSTRSKAKADALRSLGADPVVVDVFDATAANISVLPPACYRVSSFSRTSRPTWTTNRSTSFCWRCVSA